MRGNARSSHIHRGISCCLDTAFPSGSPALPQVRSETQNKPNCMIPVKPGTNSRGFCRSRVYHCPLILPLDEVGKRCTPSTSISSVFSVLHCCITPASYDVKITKLPQARVSTRKQARDVDNCQSRTCGMQWLRASNSDS